MIVARKTVERAFRTASEAEKLRHNVVRRQIEREFPPAPGRGRKPSPPGIPAQIRAAREASGLSWYAAAKAAGIANSNTVRDIEAGRDATLSSIQALAGALGLKLELVVSPTL